MNQTLKCIIVDDEEPAQDILRYFIEQVAFLDLEAVFFNAIEAIEYIAKYEIDIVFTDVKMPRISGIDMIKSFNKQPSIIITSAFQEYAIDGFNLDVIDFLVKPFSFDRFLKAVNKVKSLYQIPYHLIENQDKIINSSTDSFYVKENGKLRRVDFDNIIYIEALGDYVKIFTLIDKPIVTLITMKKIQSLLPQNLFCRIHKSFIVKISAVKSIEGNIVELENENKLQIGLQYRDNVFNYIKAIN
ncbi:LytTR family DNA-binding domain-containing protein [Arcicella rosea]|uniref:DNA-binding LytR/AlgR family response regulator n=1 Tax=Arcicella rosea TaxID=502909 RepID=A0A841ERL9_9BACT|nr:response regulator transcription factor [Arcicella rosea]MBB6004934.1 DNA-binding LytR/AlgR family response regulator [Arcicella rosea]